LSITLEVEFCLEAVEEALDRYGKPKIFNADQGSQFTSATFTGLLLENGIPISMDGKAAWRDNVFARVALGSVKSECVYIHAFETGSELRAGLARWGGFYNATWPHSRLDGRTPDEAYSESAMSAWLGQAQAMSDIKLAA